ncbi:unnamed protein product, partial [Discosporangium mesarthrocarpum]
LGTGHFGTVSTAVHKTSGEVVAVKALPRGKAPDDHVLQEIETHREAGQHPNIIGLKGVYSDDHHYYMVMDLAPGGELYNHLTKEGMLGDREVRFLMREISGAVAHLHDKGIVHFDIKPENILLGSPDQVPCKEAGIGGGGATSRPGGRALKDYTAAYSAPEVISAGEVDQKADVWSLGVIAYIMVKGTHPFDPTSKAGDEEIAANVRQAEPDWEGVEPRAANLLRRMLARNPADRPSAREVLESPWLRQIDQDP